MLCRALLALLCLLAWPRASHACDWLAPNDVFSMAQTAPRISLVQAETPSEGRIVRDLKGSGSDRITVARNNCEPTFHESGASYLVFHEGDGTAVSDSSAVLLVGDAGERTLWATERVLALPEDERAAFVEALVVNELAMEPDLYAFRLIADAVRFLGGAPNAVAADYANLVTLAQRHPLHIPLTAPSPSETLFARAASAHIVAVVRSGQLVEELTETSVDPIPLRSGSKLAPGAEYLITLDAAGADHHPPVLLLGDQRTRTPQAVDAFLAASDRRARQAVLEDFVVGHPAQGWPQTLVDGWAWLAGNGRPLAKPTCKARGIRGPIGVAPEARTAWARVTRKRLCRSR